MKGNNTQALMILSFVAYLIILSHAQNTTLITETCNQTPNYNLCVSTLNSDPKTRDAKDMRDLAIIMVLHVNNSAIKTQNHIFGLLRSRGIPDLTRKLLATCHKMYFVMTRVWLVEIIDGLAVGNYDFAQQIMGVVPGYVEWCDKSFKPPVKTPISADSNATYDISRVGNAIVNCVTMHPPPPALTIK